MLVAGWKTLEVDLVVAGLGKVGDKLADGWGELMVADWVEQEVGKSLHCLRCRIC